jgi:hypothetical protein
MKAVGDPLSWSWSRYKTFPTLGGYAEMAGTVFAVPAVAEKGYIDTRVTVRLSAIVNNALS